MAGWWSRKSSKKNHKEEEEEEEEEEESGSANFNSMKSSTRKGKKKGKVKDKANSFDELLSRKGVPLPRPLVSSTNSHDQRVLPYGSASSTSTSTSGSNASSSVSFDDHPISPKFHYPNRGQGGEMKLNVRSKSPVGLRGPTSTPAATSPLHPRFHLFSLDSAQDDGRSQSQSQGQCHPLPLPPPPSPPLFNKPSLENITNNLSKWQKGKLLGRGTFGHVYLGFNCESGQMCAIKEVKLVLDDQTSKECLKQLNQEKNLLNQLSHLNIVQYYGSELGEEALSVYLEYVSGGSIHKLLQEYGPFREPVIQIYTRQIVSGLAYLHGRNTVHRDIKGANILVDPNGEIKLADFGMAKHINSSASMLSFKGSPHWMAPEVVMNTNGYSLPVDIWSLGCTILEMATAKPPWSQFEGIAAIFKIGNSKDMPEIPEHLSNDAKNFIKLCLHRNPLARPTAQKLLDHPFIRDQSATKSSNVGITRDAFPYMFDGSRTPPVLKPHSNRTSMTSHDKDYATMPALAASRGSNDPRDNTRMIRSLPVSPSSSPLRQYGAAQKSCFVSPPHPTYTMMGQNNYASSFPVRLNATFTLDPPHETSLYRAQTPPGGSPRMRLV